MASATADDGTTPRQGRVSLEHKQLPILGLSCAAEAAGLERRLRRVVGIEEATVNPLTELAYVAYDPNRVGPAALVAAIEAAGYGIG